MTAPYRGRFAPTPTGPLHFGSLVAAVASYLDARSQQGHWLVRIEDLDPLRESPEAADQILQSLEHHQLHWDETVRFQSQRHDAYEAMLDQLKTAGRTYPCTCSRKQLAAHGGLHPARCRSHPNWNVAPPYALRFAIADHPLDWQDRLQGPQHYSPQVEVDDFVLKRKEGFYAYQLAVVCDDIDQGITDVVRGSDLLDSTPLQLNLYEALAEAPPRYLHFPVILADNGQKLSKQNRAPAIDDSTPAQNLQRALAALQHAPPADLAGAPAGELLAWGAAHWNPQALPPTLSMPQQNPR
ncbi:tRNA glutamyl-Q(34) synthetase GluQRS [Marinobacteraceae bacterium S3BR75-40.1]